MRGMDGGGSWYGKKKMAIMTYNKQPKAIKGRFFVKVTGPREMAFLPVHQRISSTIGTAMTREIAAG